MLASKVRLTKKRDIVDLDVNSVVKLMPSNHRILDGGHDLFSSIDRAQELGAQNGWSNMETFEQWAKSYFTDLSSTAGMPIFGKMSDEIYKFMRDTMGISEETARDFVTVNGQEALESIFAGTISAMGLYFAWKKEDKDAFSKIAGSILLTGAIAMNPVVIAVAVVAIAIGFQKMVKPQAIAKGAFITGSSMLISFLIPGPIILGLVPAMVVGYYLNKKMGKDFNFAEFFKSNYAYIRSDEFKQRIEFFVNMTKEGFEGPKQETA